MSTDVHRTIEAIWRIESAKLIAGLARRVRDVGIAEELAQDAFLAALEQWPVTGIPDKPGAWLMSAAKNRGIDRIRREKTSQKKHEEIGREMEARQWANIPDFDSSLDNEVSDDLLRLIFTTCHPVLSTEARVALSLKLLGGLTTDEIARAFLVTEPTIAQRIVRAKRTLTEKQIPIEVPRGQELASRLSSVLEVIYLIFNEGYTATSGDDLHRPALCEEALRLGRILAGLMPKEAEVHGLVSLMEIQASRSRARTNRAGEPVLLLEQNRAQWDQILIRRGLDALTKAEQLGGANGIYALQAAIAAWHARAKVASETNWKDIARLYGQLSRVMPSPIVELNRAVAVSMAEGPAAGLAIVDALQSDGSLKGYHLLPSVRGDFLSKLGRHQEAAEQFQKAAALTRNERERAFLLNRAKMSGA